MPAQLKTAIPILRIFSVEKALSEAPWDAWCMEVSDPFGNRLRFSEPFAADDPRA